MMACTANKTPYLRCVAVRRFATQTNPSVSQGKTGAIETTTLPNKLVVASIDNHSPVSRISVIFRAGSRNESYDNLGVTHVLRVTGGLSTSNSSAFGITRNIQQTGGSLSVSSDRELIAYNVELTRDKLDTGLKYLNDVTVHQLFKPWEVADKAQQVKDDLARIPPQIRAVDLLHRAAFRTVLGNSIFCAKHHVGKISSETLQHYVASNYKTNRTAVVGINIDHQVLIGFAKNLQIESGAGNDSPSKYSGGDLRVDKAGNWAHVAIATQGTGTSNVKDALAYAILQHAAGTEPAAKYGGYNGGIGKVVSDAIGNNAFGFSAFNASYTDNGLFGFVLSAESQDIGKGIDAAIKVIKSASISSEDIARGKEKLKTAILFSLGSDSGLITDLGAQAVTTGNVQSGAAIAATIDAISTADINAVAKKLTSGKWSIGAVGNLKNVPYANNL